MENNQIEILIKRLPHLGEIPLPAYQSRGASGVDLSAAVELDVVIAPGKRALIPTGIAVSIPFGYEAQIRPRSGLAWKHGIGLLNAPGTIDSDYRGEIKIIMFNLGEEPFVIRRGMRIAQMIVAQFVPAELKLTDELDETVRNHGGFGHTGL